MTTVATSELTEAIQELNETCTAAIANKNVKAFADLETHVSRVEAYVRETQQEMWSTEAKQAIKRLQKCEPLTETDKDVIRTFLVSDAEHYIAVENNFNDWIAELQRLATDLERRANTVDRTSIADMRGVLKDAMRLVPDIRNYLDEQQRVEKFNNALRTLDPPACNMLAKLMTEQLASDKR